MTRVAEHLAALIRVPSVSSTSNRPVIDYASGSLRRSGWMVSELPYVDERGLEKVNLIATPPRQPHETKHVELALVCHTDTVPFAADWQDALEPKQVDGNMHGCGACDVKGFLACLLTVAELQPAPASNVCIILTADEEIGCLGSKRLLEQQRVLPKRMVIGEPTSLQPARAGKGYCVGQVRILGREAHSAHPQQGVSAIYAAARAITSIEQIAGDLEQELHPLFCPGFTTLNLGTISGGSAKNIVPGAAEFLVEWRPIPGQSPQRVPDAVQRALAAVAKDYPGVTAEFLQLRNQGGFETAADAPLVRRIEQWAARPVTSIAFGSEASLWSAVCSEIVVFGPGDMQTAHSRRECMPVAELNLAVGVLERLLQQRWE